MSEQIIIPTVVLQTIKADLEAITQAVSDLYISCGNGKLARVAPHIVERVGRLAESIKDSLSDCEIEAKDPGTMVGFDPLAGVKCMKSALDMVFGAMDKSPTLAEVNAQRGTFDHCDPTARDSKGFPLMRDQLD